MSAHGKSFAGRATDALSLAVVFGILYAGVRLAPGLVGEGSRDAALLGAVGFLLLAGTLTSELVEVIGVPHLTGYLLAGIVAGPYVLHLIDHETVKRLEVVNTLAIALIALAGGAELRLDSLRQGSKTLAMSTFIQTLLLLVVGAGVFYVVTPGFVRDMSKVQIFGISLLWGVVAITRPMIDPGATMSFEAFRDLGHEVLGSVAMGTTLGLILIIYLRVVGKQLLVVLIGLGYGATEVLRYVHFEPLLTFIVAGFVVQNLSKQGDKFLHAIESTGDVVYVLFFAGAGAHLNIPLLREFWPLALLLTGSRAVATWIANRASMAIRKEEPVLKRWGWAGLVSQAGVALGIAQAISRQFPTFGPAFRDIAIACIAINELVGPVIFKFALDRAKETKAPTASLSDVEEANA